MTKLSSNELIDLRNTVEECLADSEKLKVKINQESIISILRHLESGNLRIVSPAGEGASCGNVPLSGDLQSWVVHAWVKNAILLAMRLRTAKSFKVTLYSPETHHEQGRHFAGEWGYHDKFDLQTNLAERGVRCVPGSLVREGSCVNAGVILMPSFVNIGAWIGNNTMIDTWATAGSCAQIGANVHVAGGVGIGGVLEPASARPVIIGDNAFLGSRTIVVEGAIVSSGAVLGANVCITASTPLYDVTTQEKKEYRGFVPANAVVVSGTRTKAFPGGEVPLQCGYIIAYRSAKTDAKVSLNDILRETGIAT